MDDYHINIDHLISCSDENTKVIIIANPNNPTGTVISENELIRVLDEVAPTTLVVVDEAYCEYCHYDEYPDTLKLQSKYPNLIVMRTFSKIYGLAGLRVGYTIASKEIIDQFDHYQAPFTVNHLASIAASVAIDDHDFVQKSTITNKKCRKDLFNKFSELGYKVTPSESNFLFVSFGSEEERNEVYQYLESNNVFVRKMDPFGESKAFRITIGTPEMNQSVMDFLEAYLRP